MKRYINIFITLTITLSSFSILLPPSTVSAVSGCDDSFYLSNDVVFYSPEGCDDVCGSTTVGSILGGAELPASTKSYLDSIDLSSLSTQSKGVYDYAAEQTGVPWQIIAALHYREAAMDPSKSMVDGSDLGSGINSDGIIISDDPNEDAVAAANQLITISRNSYSTDMLSDNLSIKELGEAFLAYDSGILYKQAGRSYSSSPFVANGIDDNHINMSWSQDVDGLSGVDDKKVGALAVYQYLGGKFNGKDAGVDCVGSGVVRGAVVKTALGLAQQYEVSSGSINLSDATNAFQEAHSKYNPSVGITDCGGFVSIVMRSSEVDTNFPAVGTDTILAYVSNSSSGYIEVSYNSLLPGDILLSDNGQQRSATNSSYTGHAIMYTGAVTGSDGKQYVAADASLESRVPGLRTNSTVMWMQNQVNYSAWRLNG